MDKGGHRETTRIQLMNNRWTKGDKRGQTRIQLMNNRWTKGDIGKQLEYN